MSLRMFESSPLQETALQECVERLQSRADVRLGRLLQKRMMLPGQVVAQWASSSGKHAGELSKASAPYLHPSTSHASYTPQPPTHPL